MYITAHKITHTHSQHSHNTHAHRSQKSHQKSI